MLQAVCGLEEKQHYPNDRSHQANGQDVVLHQPLELTGDKPHQVAHRSSTPVTIMKISSIVVSPL